jgi:hypothetical protein
MTAAAVFRSIESWRPCLIIDEADTFLPENHELRGVLNSGHSRATAFILRCVGDDAEPRRFATWGPKAIALIGKLPATLRSRAIEIELRRKAADDRIEALCAKSSENIHTLARKIVRWTADHSDTFSPSATNMPPYLKGREADNWTPLLAVADAAGGEWPQRARDAALALAKDDVSADYGLMLLSDLRDAFADSGESRISSVDLAAHLATLETRPWPEFAHGKPITARGIARLLEPFGIAPRTVRDGDQTFKGYARETFEDAFARYLPARPLVTPSQC